MDTLGQVSVRLVAEMGRERETVTEVKRTCEGAGRLLINRFFDTVQEPQRGSAIEDVGKPSRMPYLPY